MGFTGKLCIHPDQVSLAIKLSNLLKKNLPSEIVEAEDALERGEASIAVGSEMIDEPIYKRALATIKMMQE